MQRFFFLGLDLGDYGGEMRSEHEELVELLVARNRREAVACMRDQLAASRERVLRAVLQGRVELPIR
jgi:DNA-binding GntR family transcriptional regulator